MARPLAPRRRRIAVPARIGRLGVASALAVVLPLAASAQETPGGELRTLFRVKYLAEGVVYLDGGSDAGLAEGMKLLVVEADMAERQGDSVDPADPRVVAELEVAAVAAASAVADVLTARRPPLVGDLAYLSTADARALVERRTLTPSRLYPAVVSFAEGDPIDDEARAEVPRPPLPSVNRFRGRVGLQYLGTVSHGDSTTSSTTFGIVLRPDLTRIAGSYWNLSGYWRGRGDSRSSGQQTVQDLVNRTYHLGATYDNPTSRWAMGLGRLYLPWAPSLDTIDGGYVGRRLGEHVTMGLFAGSTPDPTSWSYDLDRRIAGAFVNVEGGSFERLRYTSTTGVGASTRGWRVDRPFVFLENTLSFGRYLSIYESLQVDSPRGNEGEPSPGAGLGRSFLTVRVQPTPRVELDLNHSYFRDLPEFDPQLVGTGLLDRYLFQGVNLSARVEVVDGWWVYGTLGRSSRTGDGGSSWNQTYGFTCARLPWLDLRLDAHYARFRSSLGDGSYGSLSIARAFGERLRLELLAGTQTFGSDLTGSDGATFLTANADVTLGRHYFLQGGVTASRGQWSYDQWMITFGYVFDSKARRP